MKKNLYNYSESLVLSLCKEIEFIRIRKKNIKNSLKTCYNKILSERLSLELEKLNKNSLEILDISKDMFKNNSKDLSLELLLEITKRTTSLQQI
tara:strand:- start:1311 stop:1592 length:282 start_codon:yes stop_codon:yes gene_type:complete